MAAALNRRLQLARPPRRQPEASLRLADLARAHGLPVHPEHDPCTTPSPPPNCSWRWPPGWNGTDAARSGPCAASLGKPNPPARGVQKLGCGRWPAGSVDAGRYCDALFIPLRRLLPGAAKTRLPDAVPLHPVACSAGPWRRRQGAGDPRSGSPTHGAAPPDTATQARARRPSPAHRQQSRVASITLVLLLGQAGDPAGLVPTPLTAANKALARLRSGAVNGAVALSIAPTAPAERLVRPSSTAVR
jgi:hypothetical protein